MALKLSYHMNEDQVELALALLEERKDNIANFGNPGDLSYVGIGKRVGVTGEAIRLVAGRDMSDAARQDRKSSQYRSASLLDLAEEVVAAGWIVCRDMLRKDTSVESFCDYLRAPRLLLTNLNY